MGDVICETCGMEGMDSEYPCWNCEGVTQFDWVHDFQFGQALKGLRLGKSVKRARWPDWKVWTLDGDSIVEDGHTVVHEISADDVLASDWKAA